MLPRKAPKARETKIASATARPCVLITGFEPFNGEASNSSWQVVRALQGRQVLGHKIITAQLPTVFGDSIAALADHLERHRPGLVICTGQAGGRNGISLERVAININDARIPDNAARQPVDTPVVAGGPAAYFTTLPIKAIWRDLVAQDIEVEISQTAGTFVCNHLFYGLMHLLATHQSLANTRGGFVHLPFLPDQLTLEMRAKRVPSMTLMDLVWGLKFAVRAALTHTVDVKLGGGAIQ